MMKNIVLSLYLKIRKSMSRGYGFGKYKPIRKILRLIESPLKSDFSEIQGSKMFLGEGDPMGISIEGVWGELDTEVFKNSIKKGDIVVDVGASIGYYTLIAAKIVGDTGKVFAFEPESKNFEILKKNVEINKYNNVTLEQKAVSDVNGKINLYLSKGIGFHSTINPDTTTPIIPIESVKLDDYFRELNLIDKIDFVKIDVEGAEFRVLNGMNTILEQSKNLKIFTEFMKYFLVQVGVEPKDMLNLLLNNGFELSYVDDVKKCLVPTNVEKLMSLDESDLTVNIMCKRIKDV